MSSTSTFWDERTACNKLRFASDEFFDHTGSGRKYTQPRANAPIGKIWPDRDAGMVEYSRTVKIVVDFLRMRRNITDRELWP